MTKIVNEIPCAFRLIQQFQQKFKALIEPIEVMKVITPADAFVSLRDARPFIATVLCDVLQRDPVLCVGYPDPTGKQVYVGFGLYGQLAACESFCKLAGMAARAMISWRTDLIDANAAPSLHAGADWPAWMIFIDSVSGWSDLQFADETRVFVPHNSKIDKDEIIGRILSTRPAIDSGRFEIIPHKGTFPIAITRWLTSAQDRSATYCERLFLEFRDQSGPEQAHKGKPGRKRDPRNQEIDRQVSRCRTENPRISAKEIAEITGLSLGEVDRSMKRARSKRS